MPNHYCNIIIAHLDYEHPKAAEWDAVAFTAAMKDVDLFQRLMPMPAELRHPKRDDLLTDGMYEWRTTHWGTKWDAYDWKAFDLPGDLGPLLISFSTAWRGPEQKLRDAIDKWLHDEHGIAECCWASHDPCDCKIRPIGGAWHCDE